MLELKCANVKFYSQKDERSFFHWLEAIACINSVEGSGNEIVITLNKVPEDNDLREILAVFYRYKINMSQLAQLETPENKQWFRENQNAYWYKDVFGWRT